MEYFECLKEEREELMQRYNKLNTFINLSPFYERLPANHKRLLCIQLEIMKGYCIVLDLRIEDIRIEDIRRCNNENDNN